MMQLRLSRFWELQLRRKAMQKTPAPTWQVPASPYGLLQEIFAHNPWKLLVTCMLLNVANGAKQVKPVVHSLFARFPTPQDMLDAKDEDIVGVINTLGLQRKRARNIKFLKGGWTHPNELKHIGTYSNDSYRMFVLGEWREIRPKDKKLILYRDWLFKHFGEEKTEEEVQQERKRKETAHAAAVTELTKKRKGDDTANNATKPKKQKKDEPQSNGKTKDHKKSVPKKRTSSDSYSSDERFTLKRLNSQQEWVTLSSEDDEEKNEKKKRLTLEQELFQDEEEEAEEKEQEKENEKEKEEEEESELDELLVLDDDKPTFLNESYVEGTQEPAEGRLGGEGMKEDVFAPDTPEDAQGAKRRDVLLRSGETQHVPETVGEDSSLSSESYPQTRFAPDSPVFDEDADSEENIEKPEGTKSNKGSEEEEEEKDAEEEEEEENIEKPEETKSNEGSEGEEAEEDGAVENEKHEEAEAQEEEKEEEEDEPPSKRAMPTQTVQETEQQGSLPKFTRNRLKHINEDRTIPTTSDSEKDEADSEDDGKYPHGILVVSDDMESSFRVHFNEDDGNSRMAISEDDEEEAEEEDGEEEEEDEEAEKEDDGEEEENEGEEMNGDAELEEEEKKLPPIEKEWIVVSPPEPKVKDKGKDKEKSNNKPKNNRIQRIKERMQEEKEAGEKARKEKKRKREEITIPDDDEDESTDEEMLSGEAREKRRAVLVDLATQMHWLKSGQLPERKVMINTALRHLPGNCGTLDDIHYFISAYYPTKTLRLFPTIRKVVSDRLSRDPTFVKVCRKNGVWVWKSTEQ